METLGTRLSKLRKLYGVTQEQLSDLLDVSPKHISHVERGESGLSINNLIEVCKFFNCSLDYLVLGVAENSILSKLPIEIVEILNTGDEKELARLRRYLDIYIELTRK